MSITLENVTKRYARPGRRRPRLARGPDRRALRAARRVGQREEHDPAHDRRARPDPDEGIIRIAGRDVTHLPPQKRDVGFVFQNYSIFRHMTVGENIEFGLRIRGVTQAERARAARGAARPGRPRRPRRPLREPALGRPAQRVALARALAYKPTVLLLDEPFGALDVKIRAQLRQSLKEIQKTLGVTTILVTHDQEEAFELGQRIGVIERGRLLEVDTPEHLYAKPASLFVATFLGAGTILVGRCREHRVALGPLTLPIPPDVPHDEGDRVRVLIRPEQVRLSAERARRPISRSSGQGEIVEQTLLGRHAAHARPAALACRACARSSPPLPFGEENSCSTSPCPRTTARRPLEPWVVSRGVAHPAAAHAAPARLRRGSGPRPGARARARRSSRRSTASPTVLGVAADTRRQDALREALAARAAEAGLKDAGRPRAPRRPRRADRDRAARGALRLRDRRRRRDRVAAGAGGRPSLAEELVGRIANAAARWCAAGRASPSASSSARRSASRARRTSAPEAGSRAGSARPSRCST